MRCQRGRRVDSSAAARSDQRQRQVECRYELAARAQDARNPSSPDAHSPSERQPECSLSTGTGRARMRRSAEPAGKRIRWLGATARRLTAGRMRSRAPGWVDPLASTCVRQALTSNQPPPRSLCVHRAVPTRRREGSEGDQNGGFGCAAEAGVRRLVAQKIFQKVAKVSSRESNPSPKGKTTMRSN